MNDTLKKITPSGDLTWWIKWFATGFMLTAIIIRSAGGPPIIDFVCATIGCIGWAWVGFRWHDRSILLLNGVVACILLIGLLRILWS